MRKLIVLLTVLLFAGGVVGSGVQGILEIWADETRSPIWEALRPDYEAQYAIASVITDFGKPEPLDDQFKTAAPTGEGPDILLGIHDRIGTLIASGLLEPLEISDELRSQIGAGALAAFTSGGNLYGIPYAQEAIVLYYNADLVDAPPASFEDMIATCAGLDLEYCITWSVNQFFFSFPMLSAQGGRVFGESDGTLNGCDVQLANEGAIAGARFMRSLVEQGLMPAEGIDYGTAFSLFKEGRAAFHINGPWEFGGLRRDGFNFGVAHIPSFEGAQPLPFLGVQGFMVSAFADDKTLAKTILTDYFATLPVQKFFFEQDQRIPVFLPLLEDEDVKSDTALVVVGSAPGIPTPNIPEMGNVWGNMDNALTLILTGQEDAATALQNAVDAINTANSCP